MIFLRGAVVAPLTLFLSFLRFLSILLFSFKALPSFEALLILFMFFEIFTFFLRRGAGVFLFTLFTFS